MSGARQGWYARVCDSGAAYAVKVLLLEHGGVKVAPHGEHDEKDEDGGDQDLGEGGSRGVGRVEHGGGEMGATAASNRTRAAHRQPPRVGEEQNDAGDNLHNGHNRLRHELQQPEVRAGRKKRRGSWGWLGARAPSPLPGATVAPRTSSETRGRGSSESSD